MSYTTRKVAAPYTLEHRVYIEKDGVPVSPFHDIPLFANQEKTILNMIVEIPRWTNAKLEVSYDLVLWPLWRVDTPSCRNGHDHGHDRFVPDLTLLVRAVG